MSASDVNWLQIPQEIWENILQRFGDDPLDLIRFQTRFESVCSEFRSIFNRFRQSRYGSIKWLSDPMIVLGSFETDEIEIISLNDNTRTYKVPLPKAVSDHCPKKKSKKVLIRDHSKYNCWRICGSSFGYLFFQSHHDDIHHDYWHNLIVSWNPLTNTQISLPYPPKKLYRVTLSKKPNSNNENSDDLFVIGNTWDGVLFCKPKDLRWTSLQQSKNIEEFLYHENKLYATQYHYLWQQCYIRLVCFDLYKPNEPPLSIVKNIMKISGSHCLVKSSMGDLIIVSRRKWNCYLVHKLEKEKNKWMTTNLRGNRLFLTYYGDCGAIYHSSGEEVECSKFKPRNCIYLLRCDEVYCYQSVHEDAPSKAFKVNDLIAKKKELKGNNYDFSVWLQPNFYCYS